MLVTSGLTSPKMDRLATRHCMRFKILSDCERVLWKGLPVVYACICNRQTRKWSYCYYQKYLREIQGSTGKMDSIFCSILSGSLEKKSSPVIFSMESTVTRYLSSFLWSALFSNRKPIAIGFFRLYIRTTLKKRLGTATLFRPIRSGLALS